MNESNPGTEWNMPTSPLANLEDARISSIPVDFKITYSGSSLPSSLDIEDHVLQNALKGGSTYHVVTVAFTEEQVSSSVAIVHALRRNNDYKCTVYVAFHSSCNLQTHTSIPALYSVSGWSKSFTVRKSHKTML